MNAQGTPPPPAPRLEASSTLGSIGLQWFREIVTAVIAITILWVTIWMMVATFRAATYTPTAERPASSQTELGDAHKDELEKAHKAELEERENAYRLQKDLLLYGLSLLGTVTGYFLGRVPAELHAAQAQRAANLSQDRAEEAKDAENKAKAEKSHIVRSLMQNVNDALLTLPSGTPASRGVPLEGQASPNNMNAVRQTLEKMRDQLNDSQN